MMIGELGPIGATLHGGHRVGLVLVWSHMGKPVDGDGWMGDIEGFWHPTYQLYEVLPYGLQEVIVRQFAEGPDETRREPVCQ